jgi:hypothetical protein
MESKRLAETLIKLPTVVAEGSEGCLTGRSLIAAMQVLPHRDLDIEPKRAAMPVRGLILCDGLADRHHR